MALHWLLFVHSPPGPPEDDDELLDEDDELLDDEELLDEELLLLATTDAHCVLELPFLQRQTPVLVLHVRTVQPLCRLPS